VSLLVSIHDVTPALAPAVERLWALCTDRGVVPALLVVPNWHGEWHLARHPDFVRWLRERAAGGAEIVLHGERHDEVGLPRTPADSVRAWGRTEHEGEFLSLDRDAARERIERGAALLRMLGLRPIGFIPPAWLAREEGHAAVGDAGLGFSEDETGIRFFPGGRRLGSAAVRWSSRGRLRPWGSVVVARGRWRLQRQAPYPRLAFHPQDLDHRAVAAELGPTLGRWLTRHQPISYEALRRRALASTSAWGGAA
jgi:predicted deacetylase